MNIISMHSPVGDLSLFEDAGAIVALDWGWVSEQSASPLLEEAQKQLNDYFDGLRQSFDLTLNPHGTLSYGELAKKLSSHARAIGGACGKNPIPIIIPCHRVLATNGGMGGYSGDGGQDTKAQLLKLEGAL